MSTHSQKLLIFSQTILASPFLYPETCSLYSCGPSARIVSAEFAPALGSSKSVHMSTGQQKYKSGCIQQSMHLLLFRATPLLRLYGSGLWLRAHCLPRGLPDCWLLCVFGHSGGCLRTCMLSRGSRGGRTPRDGYTGFPCCTKPAWGSDMVGLSPMSHAGTQGGRAFRTAFRRASSVRRTLIPNTYRDLL